MKRLFHQVNVFSADPLQGNPLAVVHEATGLSDPRMAEFARWTNLSETTYLFPPADPSADYRVRIYTPTVELPFAGHPTLGTCHAWLRAGGKQKKPGVVVQECKAGLVKIRNDGPRLEFAAPPLKRTGPLEPDLLAKIINGLNITPADVVQHQWVDNGPGWCAVLLTSAERVLAIKPNYPALHPLDLGVVGPYGPGGEAAFEVRAFICDTGYEDPVTGSLQASLAQWMIGAGIAKSSYVATQGGAIQRSGRVYLRKEGGEVWVGGDVTTCITGEVELQS